MSYTGNGVWFESRQGLWWAMAAKQDEQQEVKLRCARQVLDFKGLECQASEFRFLSHHPQRVIKDVFILI